MSPWTIPDRDLSRRIVWQLRHDGWCFSRYSGQWHAVHGEQRYIGDTLGDLMTQLERLA